MQPNIFTLLLVSPLANGLAIFYKVLFSNMGLAIIGFSLVLRFALNPLTKPYMNSMKKMKEYGPEIEKLKQRHKGDKTKYMRAQADFYKEKGINPGAGCLPYLLQIIVLIALFNVFNRVLNGGENIVDKFNELLYEPIKFAAGTVINTKFLYLDITKPDLIKLPFLPFQLPGLFVILAAVTQFLSAKVSAPYVEESKELAKKTPGAGDDFQAAMQSSAIYTFPLMTLIIGMKFSAGLALYWLLFSLYQMVQQVISTGWGGLTPWLVRLRLIQSRRGK